MKNKKLFLTLCLFLASLALPFSSNAANIINAVSCSAADVQTAVNSAATGDTVMVPAGNCTWTTNSVIVFGKNIIIDGAGTTTTVITVNSPSINAFYLKLSASRITNIGFILTASANGAGFVLASGQGYRLDHNKFDCSALGMATTVLAIGSSATGHPGGVIDHNLDVGCRFTIQGINDGSPVADSVWKEPSTIGSPDQSHVVYIEDNVVSGDGSGNDVVDANIGGRYVFRHNTVTNATIQAHSLSGGNQRGTRSWEVYDNTISTSGVISNALRFRGGTGVAFNNTITGPFSVWLSLDNEKSVYSNFPLPAGPCDGNSSWDGNTAGQNGWPCRDQIGRGTDNPGIFPQPQASEPAYFWNNTLNGSPVPAPNISCSNYVKPGDSCADIVSGRDFFNGVSRPNYTPYTYPHPLVAASISPTPPPTPITPTPAPVTPTPLTPTPTPVTPSPSPLTPQPSVPLPSTIISLINNNGTFYLIANGVRQGITNPGMLTSYGFSFSDAKPAVSADLNLPQGPLLTPGDGSLVKSKEDQTVYLISNQKRYGFTSASVFLGLGFKFTSVLVVTDPEMQSLPRVSNLDNSSFAHLPGLDINKAGTVYWLGQDNRLHAYPSISVYNSWHVQNDFSRIVPANSADNSLPIGGMVGQRLKQ